MWWNQFLRASDRTAIPLIFIFVRVPTPVDVIEAPSPKANLGKILPGLGGHWCRDHPPSLFQRERRKRRPIKSVF
jgi:hypothetical protein